MKERGRATGIIQPLARHGGRVVVALLIGSLLAVLGSAGAVLADDANPVRTVSTTVVVPGQDFEVSVTFTAPVGGFEFIGVYDTAPDDWTVSPEPCAPDADLPNTPDPLDPSAAQYVWWGPYSAGEVLTAKYKVQVPADAPAGVYTFPDGFLLYYFTGDGVEQMELIGETQIEVSAPAPATLIPPIIEYNILRIRNTEGGTVVKPSGGLIEYNSRWTCYYDRLTVVNLTAIPDPGYRFVNWTGDTGTIRDVNAASTTITMNGDYTICANFEKIPELPETPVYNLTISSAAGGSVTVPGEGTFAYNAGTVVSLVAKAGSGYRFDKWAGNVSTIADANDASTAITINGDYSIAANFAQIPPEQVTLTISSSAVGPIIITPIMAGGSVTTPGGGTFTYDKGTVVDLKAEPDWGWQFAKWTGDTGTVADVNTASTTITMNHDYSLIAAFKFGTGCFIATAAYGTPMAEDVQTLRDFRDEYMLTNPVGGTLVELYYAVSPPIAGFITEHPGLKPIVRAGLVPAVAMSTIAVDTSPAEKAAILGLLVLFSVAVTVWATRRRAQT
jgi:hypothetical protein